VRYLILAAMAAALLAATVPVVASADESVPAPDAPATVIEITTDYPPPEPYDGAPLVFPSGCRSVDVYAQQTSFIFHSRIYRFHQLKSWCWRAGSIYNERHAWSFDGSSTACLGTIYPANGWYFTWWYGKAMSGHYSEERAHVTNCIFHIGDWKEFYPDVKIWSYADGSYRSAVSN